VSGLELEKRVQKLKKLVHEGEWDQVQTGLIKVDKKVQEMPTNGEERLKSNSDKIFSTRMIEVRRKCNYWRLLTKRKRWVTHQCIKLVW